MNCPKCNSKVIKGKMARYETLVEYCSDPNQYINSPAPLRETFICPIIVFHIPIGTKMEIFIFILHGG
jgi:hypothetical protein